VRLSHARHRSIDCVRRDERGIACVRTASFRLPVALASAAIGAGMIAGSSSAMPQKSQDETEQRSTLTRVREGGTPFDPAQRLTPYAVELPGGVADLPSTGLIESPPEYGPTRGVLFQYGNSWNSVVTALVSSLTGSASFDEIAYVVVANQTTANSASSAFAAAGANLGKVVFIIQPSNSIWMRDYGPHFVWQNGTLAVVDSHYYPTRPQDNFIPTLVGDETLGVPTYDQGLYYSGGNFQPGPNRSGFCTALINLDNPSSGGHNETLIRELHQAFQGIDTLHILPQLPFSVDGTGHIDMWMYLVDENTAVISEFIAGSNATAISVTNNAVPYMQALGFEVFRPQAWNDGAGTHFTYANAFRVNNRIFIPVYGTALVPGGNSAYNTRDADALAKWQAAAGPGVQIVPIQCSSIISASGAIHCIVKQVPRRSAATPAAHIVEPAGGEVLLNGSVQTIRWNATDTGNAALANCDLAYSLDGGSSWAAIASAIADSGSFNWTVPGGASTGIGALIRVTARAADGETTVAFSNPFRVASGTSTVLDFASGAGVNKFGFGSQTSSWSSTNLSPVSTALTAANYTALSTSNATGGISDANRYIGATVSASNEATNLFRFVIPGAVSDIDEIRVRWEGFADRCTQVELYAWNYALGQWGDFAGRSGQNRYLDSFAGNRDESLVASLRSGIANYIASDGSMRFLVYAERSADETFHDYMSVTVIRADDACTGDLDGSGTIDGGDLATLLNGWGACSGCTGDLDGSGTIDGGDLATLLNGWGTCP
jgi:agmatine/peptidylarginine deiminase